MILDKELMMSDAQAVTATAVSTNTIDTASTYDLARGSPLRVKGWVDTTMTSGGAGTLAANLIESDNADLSAPSTIMALLPATALASLVAGAELFDVVLPRTTKRYLGVSWVNATAVFTGGAISAGVLLDSASPISGRPLGVTGY